MIQIRSLNRGLLGLGLTLSLLGGLRLLIQSQEHLNQQKCLKILQEKRAAQEHQNQIVYHRQRAELLQKAKEAKLLSCHDRVHLKRVLDDLVATQPLDFLDYKLFLTEKKSKGSFDFFATYINLSFVHRQDRDIFKMIESLDLPGLVIPEQLSLIREQRAKPLVKGTYHFYLITTDQNE